MKYVIVITTLIVIIEYSFHDKPTLIHPAPARNPAITLIGYPTFKDVNAAQSIAKNVLIHFK
tara:strand:+ start:368 stop:553 length:186 start_codon:yes stop_codon:yes gene_type:complete